MTELRKSTVHSPLNENSPLPSLVLTFERTATSHFYIVCTFDCRKSTPTKTFREFSPQTHTNIHSRDCNAISAAVLVDINIVIKQNASFSVPRNDDSNGPSSGGDKEAARDYDGPSGMEPEGVIESNWDEVYDSFDDMNLKEELLRGIYGYGFEKPSAIQQRAIMPCLKGYDVIAQAQSGTGKTATFSISILQTIDTSIRECQALVLAPTRELAMQIQKVRRGRTFARLSCPRN